MNNDNATTPTKPPHDIEISVELDHDGHLCDHTIWTPDIAQQLADTLDVHLETEH